MPRSTDLLPQGGTDSAVLVLEEQHRGLMSALSGQGNIGDYVSPRVQIFGLDLLGIPRRDTLATSGEPTDFNVPSAGYWQSLSIQMDGVTQPAPFRVVLGRVGGMPAGMNTLTEVRGIPLIIHWERADDRIRALSLQFYEPSALADSLSGLLRGPQRDQ